MDDRLLAQARAVASLSRRLMEDAGVRMLSISASGTGGRPRILAWGERLEPCPERTRSLAAGAKTALRREAAAVLAALRQRWPAYAVPARFGIVTDGTGIVLSPDEPDPLAPGWMGRQVAAGGLVAVLPIAPLGAFGRTLALASPPAAKAN